MSIQTMVVSKGAVVSVNATLSIPVGTEMDIINESILSNVYLQEAVTQPPANSADKRSLTQRDWPDSSAYVPAGSQEIWVWSPSSDVTLSVQVL